MVSIRLCWDDELSTICAIVNAAAEAYRGIIPDDCFHEPYMPLSELQGEVAAGVKFWGYEEADALVGVMGIQPRSPLRDVPGTLREPVRDVDLIRHAYVLPSHQRRGIGGALLKRLQHLGTRRMLVGTWVAATWAIDFYRRHGFAKVSSEKKNELLRTYWTIPNRQIETSVVLANPPIGATVVATET
jgi:GNAT superfamily N-acetyltransferase